MIKNIPQSFYFIKVDQSKTMKRLKNIILTFAIALGSVSCVSKLAYTEPDLPLPEKFQYTATADTASIANLEWKQFFNDPILQGLIEKGIKNNYDLQIALKQVASSQEKLKQAKYMQYPDVGFGVAAQISKPSKNSMNGQSLNLFLGQSHVEDYNAAFNLSWEADIWGKIKNQQEVSRMQYLQTYEGSKAIQTQVVAAIAQGYYNLLMLDTQLEITKSNLIYADNTLKFLVKQQELGLTTALAVQQQEIVKDQILKTIPAIESSVATQENALSLLTGSMPGKIERSASLNTVQSPDRISAGVPLELLSYRPDIKTAELEVRKNAAAIHVAKMSMYPALNITAQGGVNAFQISKWFSVPGSLFGMAAGAITQPILNGKQLKTQYEQSKVLADQAEVGFKQSVLKAVGEVSDALVRIQKLEEQQEIAEGLVVKSNEAVKKADLLFKYNSATYVEVIIAQTNKLNAELDLASLKAQRLNAITALYRSVGGGWQ